MLALVGAGACATGTGGLTPSHNAKSSSSVITREEIEKTSGRTAYETIQHLNPLFLSTIRASTASSQRWVYLDGVRIGGPDALRGVPSLTVREIRLLGAREATLLFGTGHSLGAITIATREGH